MKHVSSVVPLLLAGLWVPLSVGAQELKETSPRSPVVVTASRIETPLDQIGKSTSLITNEEIDTHVNTFLGTLLEPTPSMRVRQNGGPGTFAPIHIRGSSPSQVLLLINGFPVLDAANFGGDATDLMQNLFMDDVQQIEIVRGPLSTLYGADALGGTVNIITKKGEEGFKGNFFFEGGTKNTFRESATARGADDKIDYSVTVTRNDSDGLDSHDVFNATTISTRIGAEVAENLKVDSYLRYSHSRVNFDELGDPPLFVEIDDPTRLRESDALFWGLEVSHQLTDNWEQKFRYGYNLVNSQIDDELDATDTLFPGLLLRANTEGTTHNIEVLENYYGLENHIMTLGLEYERQEADASSSLFGIPKSRITEAVNNKAVFVQDQIAFWEKLFFTGGLRIDDFDSFGTTINYAFSVAYLIKEWGTKLKANVGTAFNDPSLTQLFDPVIGNPDLDAEEVIGFDFGFEQKLFEDKVMIGATFFRQDYEELISISRIVTETGIERRAVNSGKSLAQGLELEARFRLIENLNFGVNYTLTDSELEESDTRIPEIPDSLVSVFADYKPFEKLRIHLNVDFVDDSIIAPIPGFPKNEEHTTVDLALIYSAKENVSIFGRIENLFDEDYKDDTLEAPGFFAFGGINFNF